MFYYQKKSLKKTTDGGPDRCWNFSYTSCSAAAEL